MADESLDKFEGNTAGTDWWRDKNGKIYPRNSVKVEKSKEQATEEGKEKFESALAEMSATDKKKARRKTLYDNPRSRKDDED